MNFGGFLNFFERRKSFGRSERKNRLARGTYRKKLLMEISGVSTAASVDGAIGRYESHSFCWGSTRRNLVQYHGRVPISVGDSGIERDL